MDDQLLNIRHSLAHLLAAAVLKLYPHAKLGIGPVIENGFYYDFECNADQRGMKRGPTRTDKKRGHAAAGLSAKDLPAIEEEIKKMIRAGLQFSGERVTPAKARSFFRNQPFKLELIKEFSKDKRPLTIYRTGDVFVDLCRGGHVENTKELNADAFKLTHVAGAYWRGDEKNAMLTRVYGVAFSTKKELEEHLALLEEAKKRDHKRLGQELDLFTFSELVGSGLPLWTPKGTAMWAVLDEFVWQLRKERGYQRVEIPHIAKHDLYERSGHWEKFKDELFKIQTREGHVFALKPMNCPHHTQIFSRRLFSYRELPQRYANTTMCYRDEQTGELSGLSRVRAFTQDDAHVFCRIAQAKEEVQKIWEIVHIFYSAVGLSLRLRLSLRDQKHPERYLGNKVHWDKAEKTLREIAQENNTAYFEAPGEAAFYAPKLDFLGKDSLGREWQVATIQLDVNMPDRFDLTCIDEKGRKERIVMIHAAIMGSIERYLAILIEHFAGAFPLWFAPVQVVVLPVVDRVAAYVQSLVETLRKRDIRCDVWEPRETLGKRILEAERLKIPYMVVVGVREEKGKTLAVRQRGQKDAGSFTLDRFIEKLTDEVDRRVIGP